MRSPPSSAPTMDESSPEVAFSSRLPTSLGEPMPQRRSPRRPSPRPFSREGTLCRKCPRFREPSTPSVVPRRNVSPGPARTGEGGPPRWSSTSRQAPIGGRRRPTPRSFPAGPRSPRTEPPSPRAAEETRAIGRVEQRGQGCTLSGGDARGLETPRLDASPDPPIGALITLGARLRPKRTTATVTPARARPQGRAPRRLDRPTRRLGSRADPPSALLPKSSMAPLPEPAEGAQPDHPPIAFAMLETGAGHGRPRPCKRASGRSRGGGLALGPWGLPDRGQPPGERLPGCTCSTSRIGEDPAPLRGPSPWPRPDQRLERPIEFDRIDSRTRSPRPRTFVPHRLFRWDLIEIKSSFSDLV